MYCKEPSRTIIFAPPTNGLWTLDYWILDIRLLDIRLLDIRLLDIRH